MMRSLDMLNRKDDKVKTIFIPCYLTGDDGIVDLPYFDVTLGNDLSVYPSYYEPWGYTPLESTAFHVPTITTNLSGFGLWVNSEIGRNGEIADGVKVIHRTDYNYSDVANAIKETIVQYANMSDDEVKSARDNASKLSKRALWKQFIVYYEQAYDLALRKAAARQDNKKK